MKASVPTCSLIFMFFCLTASEFLDGITITKKNQHATLSTGRIAGIHVSTGTNTAKVFLNIPYAAGPAGKRRFMPPLPPKSWPGTLDCTKSGPACPQEFSTVDRHHIKMDEDCLNLNVYAGTNCTQGNPCPVVLYVLGGAFYFGIIDEYPMRKAVDNFASTGIVFLIINYRVGFLGMWGTGKPDAPKNLMHYDILRALQWIQKEIRNVGGDPNKVSLMGHSSGSSCAAAVSLSQKSKGLFHQGIFMSGPPTIFDCDHINMELAARLDCATVESWNSGNTFQQISDCMKQVPLDRFLKIQMIMQTEGRQCYGAQFDGPDGLFPTSLKDLRARREPYDALLGDTKLEYGNLNGPFDLSDNGVIGMCAVQGAVLGFTALKSVSQQCPAFFNSKYGNKTEEVKELSDSFWFVGMYEEARTLQKNGAKIYLYSFDYVRRGMEGQVPFHSYELAWLVGLNEFQMSPEEEEIGRFFNPLFSNFIKYGNPTPSWSSAPRFEPLASPDGYNYYSIDIPQPENLLLFHPGIIEFWTGIAPAIESARKPVELGMSMLSSHFGNSIYLPRNNFKAQTADEDLPDASPRWEMAFFIVLSIAVILLVLLVVGVIKTARKQHLGQRKEYLGVDIEAETGDIFEKSRLLDPTEFDTKLKSERN